jgi:hypothetical protein
MHPTEDDLIELLSGEADAADRVRIEAHVKSCDDCRQAWDDLTAALTIVGDAVPEPPAGFERVMWARVRAAIERPEPLAWTWRQWAPAAALAATVLVGAAIAGNYSTRQSPAPGGSDASLAGARPDAGGLNERVLYTALDEHLQQTEALLVELRNAPDRAGLALERGLADDLVFAGRLYRVTAEFTGDYGLVSMLDDLETVLVEVARAPGKLDTASRQWLRARIEDDALLFKVRAVSNDLRDRVANPDD